MTDKPKPSAMPGVAEVSPKFVDEAEAAAAAPPSSASAATETLAAHEAYQTAWRAMVDLTSSDDFTAEEETRAGQVASNTFYRFLAAPARTDRDLLLKMEAWARFDWSDRGHVPGDRDVDLDGLAALGDGPAAGVAALRDLRRMVGGSAVMADNKGVATRGLDPAAQIGRDLAATWRQIWRNDEKRPSTEAHSPERTRLKHLDFHLGDRMEALEAMAAEVQASTLEGAMVQIMLAHAEADVMAASTEESSEAQMRTISRLLYSALTVLERVASAPREELGEAYMCRDLDPHALVAKD